MDAMPIRLLICFLAGSIPFAILAMKGTGIDVRRAGSGNPGFNNVLRFSKWRALLTLAGDLGKGSLAVWLFLSPSDSLLTGWLYGFAVVLGHCYTPWLRFRGGKGIATSTGVMLILYPRWALMVMCLYLLVRLAGSRLKWKEAGAIGSLTCWSVFTLVLLGYVGPQDGAASALMTLLLAWRHKSNFRNLLATA